MSAQDDESKKGRRASLVIAGTAVFWVVASFVGGQLGLDNRTRALFDLMAFAGFVWGLWMVFQIWRARQDNQR